MPRKAYKKRTYKKRTYKAKRYRRRYYKRRYYRRKAIKKPEIHIVDDNLTWSYNNLSNGEFKNITTITGQVEGTGGGPDTIKFSINGKGIEGRKIRLKYLYIKGYLYTTENNVNGKIYVIRRQKNGGNAGMSWQTLLNMPVNVLPSNWTDENINDVLYRYDWKNDLNGQIKHYVKSIYKSYDNNNNYIPFKIRIPLYDCVLTCDNEWVPQTQIWIANANPSTNAIYLSYVTNAPMGEGSTTSLKLKYKLYYTDY